MKDVEESKEPDNGSAGSSSVAYIQPLVTEIIPQTIEPTLPAVINPQASCHGPRSPSPDSLSRMAHPTLPTDLLYPIITLVFESWLDDYLTLDGNPSSRLDESNPMKQLLIVSFNVRQVTLRIMSDKLGFKLQIEGIWRYVALLAG